MRLVSFKHEEDLGPRVGVLNEDLVIDIARAHAAKLSGEGVIRAVQHSETLLPGNMTEFLAEGDEGIRRAENAVQYAIDQNVDRALFDKNNVTELPVVPDPDKIICIGLNYRSHAEDGGFDIPEYPTLFAKYANSLIADGDTVLIPEVSDEIDYEVELAVVMGKRARYVDEQEAYEYVAGYSVINDVSLRNYQMNTSQWLAGKTFDHTTPLGPSLVTKDQIDDPHDLDLSTEVNGEALQEANTSDMIFTIPEMISYITEIMTLEPGDIIATGTPTGIGFLRDPHTYMEHDDVMETFIEDIGVLRNRVISEA